jgi:hypothetical protein
VKLKLMTAPNPPKDLYKFFISNKLIFCHPISRKKSSCSVPYSPSVLGVGKSSLLSRSGHKLPFAWQHIFAKPESGKC